MADFNASHPNINLVFERNPYTGARDKRCPRTRLRQRSRHRRPGGRRRPEAFHGQWLDLSRYIAKIQLRPERVRPDGHRLLQAGRRGPDRPSVRGLPVASSTTSEPCSTRPASTTRPHKYGDKYTMPDGVPGQLGLRHHPQGRDVADRRQERLRRDPGRFDPKNIAQYGFEPQRDDLRGLGAYLGAGQLMAADGKTAQIPALGRRMEVRYNGIWTDHFIDKRLRFRALTSRRRLHLQLRQGRDAGELPLAICCLDQLPAATGIWRHCRPTTARSPPTFNADTFRVLKASKNPEAAFEVLTYLLGDGAPELLNAYGGCPARKPSGRLLHSWRSRPTEDGHSRRSRTGRSRSTASSTPTCPTWNRTCRHTTRPSTRRRAASTRPAGDRQGLEWTWISRQLQSDIQTIWDKWPDPSLTVGRGYRRDLTKTSRRLAGGPPPLGTRCRSAQRAQIVTTFQRSASSRHRPVTRRLPIHG